MACRERRAVDDDLGARRRDRPLSRLRAQRVLAYPISLVDAVAGPWLITLHVDRRVVLYVVRTGVLNVVLACVLTPLFRPIGTAWSVVCAEAVAAADVTLAMLEPGTRPAVKLFARTQAGR
jgi:hypothetical protein